MEYLGIYINLKNNTQTPISKQSDKLTWGKWKTNLPTQIAGGGAHALGIAEGREAADAGTKGSVVYMLGDNQTTLTISFDIPMYGDNSGGMVIHGPSASNYVAQETDESYVNVVSFPAKQKKPTTYFVVANAPPAS